MPKIVFTQEQQLDLTRRLQLLLLESLASVSSWDVGSTRFQGGTCLSLSYGSPRFSEDLDFVLGTDRGLNRMMGSARSRMVDALRTSLPGALVKFVGRDEDLEASNAKNPRTFNVTVSHPDWYRVVKIKVEFWVADIEAVRQYESRVIPAKLLTQAVEGVPLRMALRPVMLPTATINEILVDKLHALACRPYLKHRDIFDLWWIAEQGVSGWGAELMGRYPYHARMYSDSPSIEQLGDVLRARIEDVRGLVGNQAFAEDLRKWLGEGSALSSSASADAMAAMVVQRLERLVDDLWPKPKTNAPAETAGAARGARPR